MKGAPLQVTMLGISNNQKDNFLTKDEIENKVSKNQGYGMS
jgi:hypothetical protein